MHGSKLSVPYMEDTICFDPGLTSKPNCSFTHPLLFLGIAACKVYSVVQNVVYKL